MKPKKPLAKISQKPHFKIEANLLSFSPRKIADRNSFIVKQLKKATSIFNHYDNNIALEGDYGTGKSSIIRQLKGSLVWRLINKPKIVSFFAFSGKGGITNLKMQSEIVRQLYFGEDANKLKGSSYKRIGKHYYRISIVAALLLGIFTIPTLLGTDFLSIFDSIGTIINSEIDISKTEVVRLFIWVASMLLITILVNVVLKLLSSVTIKNVSAKDLSVELLDKRPDFDQLIDLLVFYFKNTKRRVIIFEDLDRFDKPKIFEELRQLNFILNNRLRLLGKIKFIYATKGDLFKKSTSNEVGVEDIRTKVFDLIIPVVPFLAKINYDTVFQDEYSKAGFSYNITGIEKILSRHSSDMRVIKAIINNMIVYDKTFKLESVNDYKNCAALSIIRLFEPGEFKDLSTSNSSLDTILGACRKLKNSRLKDIEKKYAIDNKIKTHSDEIWTALKAYGESIPTNYQLQSASVDGITLKATDDDILTKMYNARSSVQISWTYRNKSFTPDQIKEIFNQFTRSTPEELQNKEQEIRGVVERDPFEFYTEAKGDLNENNPNIPIMIEELVENGFVTEDYMRFTAKSASDDININNAKRYIFNNIRGKERDVNCSITPEMAEIILNEIDNTDLASTGLYNYDLFDYIIKNQAKYHYHLERLFLNAKADLNKFMEFFDSYCYKYKTELENEKCTRINESVIDELSKTIPPTFLTMKLAKIYPNELMKKVTWSSLGDTNAKKVIYTIAVISLESPLDIILEETDRSFLSYYADTIIENENGKANLFGLNIANGVPINNIEAYNISNEEIQQHLEKIIIVINEQNLNFLAEDILIGYIAIRRLTVNDFSSIMKSNQANVKQYVAKNIEKTMTEDALPRCLQEAAAYIYEKKVALSASELLQYAGKINTKNLIGMIIISDLTKEEIVMIMSKCNDRNLNKIQVKGSIIKLDINRHNEMLAEQLITLGLVNRQNSLKNKKIIRLQVL